MLAADARNKMGLLSIQTPVLEMGSYDLSTTIPGIFLLIYTTAFAIPAHLLSFYSHEDLSGEDSLILERPCVWCHTILVEK